MLTFREFERCVNTLREEMEYEGKCAEIGFDIFEFYPTSRDASVVHMLEKLMHDEYDTISWWCYEKNFGRDEKINMYDENDNLIPMDTAKELYDYIVKFSGKKPIIRRETSTVYQSDFPPEETRYYCPNCETELYIERSDGTKIGSKDNYCKYCGEKILWC